MNAPAPDLSTIEDTKLLEELARRMALRKVAGRDLLDNPHAVASYLHLRHYRTSQEVAGAVFLDVRNRLIADEILFAGGMNRCMVEPRQVLKRALELDAAGVILFHNHPSGDPAPSAEDHAVTRRMTEAGELMGVKLVDHIILGSAERWASLARCRVM